MFFRLNLPLNKFRRQCYSGAGDISGQRTGVAMYTESRIAGIISNCMVLRPTRDDAKDVDRAPYGDEGKNSQRFVSYEHIPLPERIMLGELLLKHADNLN